MPRPLQAMVRALTTNFNKAFGIYETDGQLFMDRADEVIGRVILPTDNLQVIIAAATSGSVFILAEGTHSVLSPTTWTGLTDVTIIGRPGAIVSYTGSGTFLTASNCSRVVVQGFRLQLSNASAANTGIEFTGATCDDCRVLDMNIVGTTAYSHVGVYSHPTAGARQMFSRCVFSGTYVRGIDVTTLNDSTISSNIVYDPTGVGIRVYDAVRCTISDNDIYSSGSHGVQILTSARASSDITVDGNTISDSGDHGIAVAGGASYGIDAVTISGNTIKTSTNDAINMGYVTHFNVSGNTFRGWNKSPVAQDGYAVDIASTCSNGTISANNASNGWGFVRIVAATWITIASNQVEDVFRGIGGDGATDVEITGNAFNISQWEYGIYFGSNGVTRCDVVGNILKRTSGGVFVEGQAYQVTIIGNKFFECYNQAIEIDNSSGNYDIVIQGNVMHTALQDTSPAMQLYYMNGCVVDGNEIYDWMTDALKLHGNDMAVSNNVMRAIDGNAIVVYSDSQRVVIDANSLYDIGADGINVEIVDGVISDNYIRDPAGKGIIADDPVRVTIQGNNVYSSGSHGIYVFTSSAAASDLVVCDNNVTDATGYGIGLVGTESYAITDCVIDGNKAAGSTDGLYLDYVKESVIGGRYKSAAGDGIQDTANCDQLLYSGIHTRGSGTATNFNSTNRTLGDNK